MLLSLLGSIWGLAGIYLYLSPNLPDVETLRDVQLQTPMRVYTREGDLIGQFGEQKRTPLADPIIPIRLIMYWVSPLSSAVRWMCAPARSMST